MIKVGICFGVYGLFEVLVNDVDIFVEDWFGIRSKGIFECYGDVG